MLAFKVVRLVFPSITGSSQNITAQADFGSPVRIAHVALNGFDVNFSNGARALKELRVDCAGTPLASGNIVLFTVNILLTDSSAIIDDPYGGFVDVLVIADLL